MTHATVRLWWLVLPDWESPPPLHRLFSLCFSWVFCGSLTNSWTKLGCERAPSTNARMKAFITTFIKPTFTFAQNMNELLNDHSLNAFTHNTADWAAPELPQDRRLWPAWKNLEDEVTVWSVQKSVWEIGQNFPSTPDRETIHRRQEVPKGSTRGQCMCKKRLMNVVWFWNRFIIKQKKKKEKQNLLNCIKCNFWESTQVLVSQAYAVYVVTLTDF